MSATGEWSTGIVQRVDLGDAVAGRLREQILRGELPPGTRLVESTLAASFGTSRGPIRDAINRLETSGLVTVNPRRGAYVTSFTADDVDEIYNLRIALETLAVTRAAARGTAADWQAMARSLKELAQAFKAGDNFGAAEADMRFHQTMVLAAHQDRLAKAWNVFADQTLLVLQELSHIGPEIQAATGGHAEILDSLEQGDGRSAARQLRQHLAAAQRLLREQFRQR